MGHGALSSESKSGVQAPSHPSLLTAKKLLRLKNSHLRLQGNFERLSGWEGGLAPALRLKTAAIAALLAAAAVVLFEFAIEGFAADAERAGGVSFIAVSVVECSLNCLPFYFIH